MPPVALAPEGFLDGLLNGVLVAVQGTWPVRLDCGIAEAVSKIACGAAD